MKYKQITEKYIKNRINITITRKSRSSLLYNMVYRNNYDTKSYEKASNVIENDKVFNNTDKVCLVCLIIKFYL